MSQRSYVRISKKLLQELIDSSYGLMLYRYQAEDMKDLFAPADQLTKQAQQALRTARRRGLPPTGYGKASELLLDLPLRRRRATVHEPVVETVYNLSHITVNDLVKSHFALKGYDCASGWDSDHIQCLKVSLKYYGQRARREVACFQRNPADYWIPPLEDLLCELARCGLLPEGNYEIWVE